MIGSHWVMNRHNRVQLHRIIAIVILIFLLITILGFFFVFARNSGWKKASRTFSRASTGDRTSCVMWRIRTWTIGCGLLSFRVDVPISCTSKWNFRCATAVCFPAMRWAVRKRFRCSTPKCRPKEAKNRRRGNPSRTSWSTGLRRTKVVPPSTRRYVIFSLSIRFNFLVEPFSRSTHLLSLPPTKSGFATRLNN